MLPNSVTLLTKQSIYANSNFMLLVLCMTKFHLASIGLAVSIVLVRSLLSSILSAVSGGNPHLLMQRWFYFLLSPVS